MEVPAKSGGIQITVHAFSVRPGCAAAASYLCGRPVARQLPIGQQLLGVLPVPVPYTGMHNAPLTGNMCAVQRQHVRSIDY